MKKKIFVFLQVAIFLVSTVSGTPHARALEIATVTVVTTERNGAQNGFNQNVQHHLTSFLNIACFVKLKTSSDQTSDQSLNGRSNSMSTLPR